MQTRLLSRGPSSRLASVDAALLALLCSLVVGCAAADVAEPVAPADESLLSYNETRGCESKVTCSDGVCPTGYECTVDTRAPRCGCLKICNGIIARGSTCTLPQRDPQNPEQCVTVTCPNGKRCIGVYSPADGSASYRCE